MKNPAAVALGKMAKGVPKKFSAAEIKRRRKLMETINKKRRTAKAANTMNTPNNFTPMTLTKNKVRLEINLHDGSGSIALPLADEELAKFILTACNEHAALCAVADAAERYVQAEGDDFEPLLAALSKLKAIRNQK